MPQNLSKPDAKEHPSLLPEALQTPPQETRPANVIPAAEILAPSSREEWTQNVIGSEPHLDRRPIFALDKRLRKRRGALYYQLKKTERHGDQLESIEWNVAAHPIHGYPNSFDRDVLYALFKLVHDRGLIAIRDVTGETLHWLPFTTYEVAAILRPENPKSGKLYRDIKASLTRLNGVTIESIRSFFYKPKRTWIDKAGAAFHLIEMVLWRDEPHPSGRGVCTQNFLLFGPLLRNNIRTKYLKPLDLNYYYHLRNPVTKALYCYLTYYLYAAIRSGADGFRKSYSGVCEEIMLLKRRYFSSGRKDLEPAIQKLQATGFLDPARSWFEPIQGRTDDGILCFYPGPLARELCAKEDRLRDQGVPAPEEQKSGPQATAPTNTLPPSGESTPVDTLEVIIERLGRLFYRRLKPGTGLGRAPGKKDREGLREFLQSHSAEEAEAFIGYALAQRATRWPDMATLSGALEAYDAEFTARQAPVESMPAPQGWGIEAEYAVLRQAYYRYLVQEIPRIQTEFPTQYQAFEAHLQASRVYQALQQLVAQGITVEPEEFVVVQSDTLAEVLAVKPGLEATEMELDPQYGILGFLDWCRSDLVPGAAK